MLRQGRKAFAAVGEALRLCRLGAMDSDVKPFLADINADEVYISHRLFLVALDCVRANTLPTIQAVRISGWETTMTTVAKPHPRRLPTHFTHNTSSTHNPRLVRGSMAKYKVGVL